MRLQRCFINGEQNGDYTQDWQGIIYSVVICRLTDTVRAVTEDVIVEYMLLK
jgi:hypothetical protein